MLSLFFDASGDRSLALAWSTHEDGEEEITRERDLKNRSFSATETRMAIHYFETSFAFFFAFFAALFRRKAAERGRACQWEVTGCN